MLGFVLASADSTYHLTRIDVPTKTLALRSKSRIAKLETEQVTRNSSVTWNIHLSSLGIENRNRNLKKKIKKILWTGKFFHPKKFHSPLLTTYLAEPTTLP